MIDFSVFDNPKVRRIVRWILALIPLLCAAPLCLNGLFLRAGTFWLEQTMIISVFQYPWWSDEPLEVRLKYLDWMPWYVSFVQRPILCFFGKQRRIGRWSFTIGWTATIIVCSLFGSLMLCGIGWFAWDLVVHPASRKALEDQMGTDPQMTFIWIAFVRSRVIFAVMFILTIAAWKWVDYQQKKDS